MPQWNELIARLDWVNFIVLISLLYWVLLVYWCFRHIFLGAGKVVRDIDRLNDILLKRNGYTSENATALDSVKKGRVVSALWNSYFLCIISKKETKFSTFFNYENVAACCGFGGALFMPILFVALGLVFGYSAEFIKPNDALLHYFSSVYVALWMITGIFILVMLLAWVASRTQLKMSVSNFLLTANCMLPDVEGERGRDEYTLEDLADLVDTLPGRIAQATASESTPVPVVSTEERTINELVDGGVQRMEDSIGPRFEKVILSLEQTFAYQKAIADRLNLIIDRINKQMTEK